MPFWVIILVQWLHVFCGIFWFGSRLVVTFILLPAMRRVSQAQQHAFMSELIRHFVRVEPAIGVATIALGFLRGTLLGAVINAQIAFGTVYGLTWTTALAIGVGIAILGGLVGSSFQRLQAIPVKDDGSSQVAYTSVLSATEGYSRLSLGLFLLIFTCMILMRFGY